MNRQQYISLTAITMLAGVALISQARIFERSVAVADSTRALLSAGGTVAYEAPISINGGKGSFTVLGFNKPIQPLFRELTRLFHTRDATYAGGTMALLTAKAEGLVMKITLLKLSDNTPTLALKTVMPESEEKAATAAPTAGHRLNTIPPFPGSEPVFYGRDDKSNAGFEISLTPADAPSIHGFFGSKLTATGWTPTLPPASSANPPGLLIYSRHREICCVMVDQCPGTTKNRITLLHKQQGIE